MNIIMTLIRRLTACFWHSRRCNIAGDKLQKFRYDRRQSDGDLTIMRKKCPNSYFKTTFRQLPSDFSATFIHR